MDSYLVTTSISSKGQIVLPAEIRRKDGIKAGQQITVQRIKAGIYRLTRQSSQRTHGLAKWYRACPGKDFFVPIKSESTDTL